MTYFERTLLNFLNESKIEMEIRGFDMDSFERALHQEFKSQLELIEYIVFQDEIIESDTEKIASIKRVFQNEFYSED